jgi:hypothetical protein
VGTVAAAGGFGAVHGADPFAVSEEDRSIAHARIATYPLKR